jgi:hypothetical protein
MKAARKRGPARAFGSNYSNYLAADARLTPGAKCQYVVITKRQNGIPAKQYPVEVVIQQLLGEKSALVKYVCPVSHELTTKKTLLNKLNYITTEILT